MEERWTTVLKPKSKWLDINLKELFSYKDLIFLFVKSYLSLYILLININLENIEEFKKDNLTLW